MARVDSGSDSSAVELEVGHRTVRITNPERVYFPARGETKIDLVRYYLSVGDGIVRALRERPCMLHRFPTGVSGPKVHQKRLPAGAPPWVQTVRVDFPSGRTAHELRVTELADVVWAVQMSTVEFHPWNTRAAHVERPDEWRIDLAYSVRGVPEAVVSTPLRWDEVPDAEPGDFTLASVPERFARLGDVHAGIDDAVFSLEPLLEWADRDEVADVRRS